MLKVQLLNFRLCFLKPTSKFVLKCFMLSESCAPPHRTSLRMRSCSSPYLFWKETPQCSTGLLPLQIDMHIDCSHGNPAFTGLLLFQVIVDDLGNKAVYEFPISRWFAIDEDDGKIQRDVLVGGSQPTGKHAKYCSSYNLQKHQHQHHLLIDCV